MSEEEVEKEVEEEEEVEEKKKRNERHAELGIYASKRPSSKKT